jgi:hypothetical protein
MILTMYEPMSFQFPGKKKRLFRDTLKQRRMSPEARYKCHKCYMYRVFSKTQYTLNLVLQTLKLSGWATGKGLNLHSGSTSTEHRWGICYPDREFSWFPSVTTGKW